MARNTSPKCKQCRRVGAKLFLRGERCDSSKCALVKRNYIPGLHGTRQGKPSKLSGYGLQLREKQKAKKTYRLLEKQFSNYFAKAIKQKGDTGANLFRLLESRLDSVIYRAGYALSRDQARQLVNHGHFCVNGRKVSIPSCQVKVKDKITLNPVKAKKNVFATLADSLKNKELVDWIAVDPKDLSAVLIDEPNLKKVEPGFDLKMITEYYSR